jgi:ribonuclease HI
MNDYIVFCDGAYSSSLNQGGIGIVVLKREEDKLVIVSKYSKMFRNTTNNRMELLSAIYALSAIKRAKSITIYSDSMYLIGTVTQNWKRKKNQDLWEKLDKILLNTKTPINWFHVKGHSTSYYNNIADRLAVEASTIADLE